MSDVTFLIGQRIKAMRRYRGMLQDELSIRTELSRQYISMVEVGKRTPSIEALETIAKVLGCELVVTLNPNKENNDEPLES